MKGGGGFGNRMTWKVEYLTEALADLEKLDNSIRRPVLKGISKVQENPLPRAEGGDGVPLGNKDSMW